MGKKGFATVPKGKTVPVVVAEGQTLADALRAAWNKAHEAK